MNLNSLFEGKSDRTRLRQVRLAEDSYIRILSPEDILADRVGQYWADPVHGHRPLAQVRMLYLMLEPQLDHVYLEQRLKDETLDELNLAYFRELLR